MPEYPGDEAILALLKTGNTGDAFEFIFKKYYRLMWTKAYLGTGDATDADDLVQSVLSSIWERALYHNINGSLKSYLLISVRNQVNDYHKVKQRALKRIERYAELVDQDCVFESREPDPEDRWRAQEQLHRQLHELLEELPTQRQRAFTLVYMQQKKYHEVADNMGISVNSLKTHLKIAVKTLRNKLFPPIVE
ncbi:RNA polymerase sigma factor [Chitinophaga eiseniae]|uniref:Sigma-70 family RNA polymerase sigma factor n=1 Tax=Chitinophaga eiseniae TaxID=634771 RepID=A0A847SEJ5_9BACT|nr:sigma-70 family RNA polymerase sigma factor [Chitinophaga eiseniae]NLR77267.1 sigma-70 family RNA polymerase sigma factor [Chitinophaga eiseniae]